MNITDTDRIDWLAHHWSFDTDPRTGSTFGILGWISDSKRETLRDAIDEALRYDEDIQYQHEQRCHEVL